MVATNGAALVKPVTGRPPFLMNGTSIALCSTVQLGIPIKERYLENFSWLWSCHKISK